MNYHDFDAVVYDGEIFCIACLPDGVNADSDEVSPIFAGSEWGYIPVCCECGTEHDYVTVIEYPEA